MVRVDEVPPYLSLFLVCVVGVAATPAHTHSTHSNTRSYKDGSVLKGPGLPPPPEEGAAGGAQVFPSPTPLPFPLPASDPSLASSSPSLPSIRRPQHLLPPQAASGGVYEPSGGTTTTPLAGAEGGALTSHRETQHHTGSTEYQGLAGTSTQYARSKRKARRDEEPEMLFFDPDSRRRHGDELRREEGYGEVRREKYGGLRREGLHSEEIREGEKEFGSTIIEEEHGDSNKEGQHREEVRGEGVDDFLLFPHSSGWDETEEGRSMKGHGRSSHGRHKLRHSKRRRHRERNMELLLLESDFGLDTDLPDFQANRETSPPKRVEDETGLFSHRGSDQSQDTSPLNIFIDSTKALEPGGDTDAPGNPGSVPLLRPPSRFPSRVDDGPQKQENSSMVSPSGPVLHRPPPRRPLRDPLEIPPTPDPRPNGSPLNDLAPPGLVSRLSPGHSYTGSIKGAGKNNPPGPALPLFDKPDAADVKIRPLSYPPTTKERDGMTTRAVSFKLRNPDRKTERRAPPFRPKLPEYSAVSDSGHDSRDSNKRRAIKLGSEAHHTSRMKSRGEGGQERGSTAGNTIQGLARLETVLRYSTFTGDLEKNYEGSTENAKKAGRITGNAKNGERITETERIDDRMTENTESERRNRGKGRRRQAEELSSPHSPPHASQGASSADLRAGGSFGPSSSSSLAPSGAAEEGGEWEKSRQGRDNYSREHTGSNTHTPAPAEPRNMKADPLSESAKAYQGKGKMVADNFDNNNNSNKSDILGAHQSDSPSSSSSSSHSAMSHSHLDVSLSHPHHPLSHSHDHHDPSPHAHEPFSPAHEHQDPFSPSQDLSHSQISLSHSPISLSHSSPSAPPHLSASCYSTNDVVAVVFLTSLANMVAFVVVTVVLCWCSLRGRITTVPPRSQARPDRQHHHHHHHLHHDLTEDESEENVAAEGCLEACLPDISYQRHIARGSLRGPSFVVSRALRPLVHPLSTPRHISHAVTELLHNLTAPTVEAEDEEELEEEEEGGEGGNKENGEKKGRKKLRFGGRLGKRWNKKKKGKTGLLRRSLSLESLNLT